MNSAGKSKKSPDYYNSIDIAEQRRQTSPFQIQQQKGYSLFFYLLEYLDMPFQFEDSESELNLQVSTKKNQNTKNFNEKSRQVSNQEEEGRLNTILENSSMINESAI